MRRNVVHANSHNVSVFATTSTLVFPQHPGNVYCTDFLVASYQHTLTSLPFFLRLYRSKSVGRSIHWSWRSFSFLAGILFSAFPISMMPFRHSYGTIIGRNNRVSPYNCSLMTWKYRVVSQRIPWRLCIAKISWFWNWRNAIICDNVFGTIYQELLVFVALSAVEYWRKLYHL